MFVFSPIKGYPIRFPGWDIFLLLVCGKTRTLDALYQISLAEQIHDNEREDYHKTVLRIAE